MARSLRALVRLHDYEIDQRRRELAELLAALDALEDRSRRLEAEVVSEKKVAAAEPAVAGFHYGGYVRVVIERRERLATSIDEAEAKVAAAMDRLHDAYREHKKFETAEAERRRLELDELGRREQIVLDEVALQSFLRRDARQPSTPRRKKRSTSMA